MAEQTIQQQPKTQQREIAVFDNLNAAQAAKQLLKQAEVALQDVSIEGDINDYEEVAAMGTTVGAEAGISIGAFLGGTLGVIFVSIYSTLVYGDLVNSTFNQFAIVAFILAGAIFGFTTGRRIRNAHLPAQKQKGNPNVPRRFPLIVEGDSEALAKASELLGYSTAS